MKPKTNEQFELISKYFELKDNLETNEKLFESIQMTYNVALSPYPEIFAKLNDYFSQNKFDKFTSSISEQELSELRAELERHSDDLSDFAGKLETFEIKLKMFLQMNRKGVFYDQDIVQMKGILSKLTAETDLIINETEEEGSDRIIAKATAKDKQDGKADEEDSFEDEQFDFNDITKTLDEKVKEGAKALAECLDSESNKLNDAIKKEIDKELGFIIDAAQDTDFLKIIEINDTKIDKLESQIREIEKKEKLTKTRLHNFEKYLQDSTANVKPTQRTEQEVTKFEWLKRCDRLGSLKRYRSDSCLETYDRKPAMLDKIKRSKKFIKAISIIQEMYLSKIEDYNFVSKDYTIEKQTLFDKLMTIFMTHDKYKLKNEFSQESLNKMLAKIPDKEVQGLIQEMWRKNEAIEKAEEDLYYSNLEPSQKIEKPRNGFQAVLQNARSHIEQEMAKLNEVLKMD